eukprot:2495851-Prymnesium_polylepis.1
MLARLGAHSGWQRAVDGSVGGVAESDRQRAAFLSLQQLGQQIRRASRSSMMEHRRRSITIRSPPLTQRSAARRAGSRPRAALCSTCGQGP